MRTCRLSEKADCSRVDKLSVAEPARGAASGMAVYRNMKRKTKYNSRSVVRIKARGIDSTPIVPSSYIRSGPGSV